MKPGPNNTLTDVTDLIVGHYTDKISASGTTVVLCQKGAVGGVDVRGSAPGTRETDLLNPVNLVDKVHGIVLSGGSVYGLSTADGAVAWLSENGWGLPMDQHHVVPIVPSAVLYDLGRGHTFIPKITKEWGQKACIAAGKGPIQQGSVGAGTGARSGNIKGGIGSASIVLDSGISIAALMAVNSFGSVINPIKGTPWEIDSEISGEFGDAGKRSVLIPKAPFDGLPGGHTTIGVVATDADLTKAQAQKIAGMAHDGMARAIRPSHTMYDGDTIFCLSTQKISLKQETGPFKNAHATAISEIGDAAAQCTVRAIIHAIFSAEALNDLPAYCDLKDKNQ